MENIFYEDEFFSELSDLLEQLEIEEDKVAELPEDYELIIYYGKLEPIVTFSAEWIEERINDERFPEECDAIIMKLHKALVNTIDFDKLNALVPKLYYPERKKSIITKKDILEYIS